MGCRYKLALLCRGNKYYGQPCGRIRALTCDYRIAAERRDADAKRTLEEGIEEKRYLGVGA